MKPRVLWIENQATEDLDEFTTPIRSKSQYSFVIAEDATKGEEMLFKSEWDCVIVDIRIEPGDNEKWTKLYYQHDSSLMSARLGMALLYSFLRPDIAEVGLAKPIPSWITNHHERFAVFTVESANEVRDDLILLGISEAHYLIKETETPETALIDLIQKVLQNH